MNLSGNRRDLLGFDLDRGVQFGRQLVGRQLRPVDGLEGLKDGAAARGVGLRLGRRTVTDEGVTRRRP